MVTLSKRNRGSFSRRYGTDELTLIRHIPVGGAALVRIQLTNKRGVPMEPFHVNRTMGRVILRSEGVTVGAGVVISLETS